MTPVVYDQEWRLIASFLPQGWEEKARQLGAIRRNRGVTDPQVLLRLFLMHVATGLSLVNTVSRAQTQGLAKMSDAGLLDRLRRAGPWLEWICRQMFTNSRYARVGRGEVVKRRQVRAVDGTTISEPGATGTDWKVHMSIALPEMRCDFFVLTSVQKAETFKRVPVFEGDILLGDRGYAHREAVANVLKRKGDVVVRVNNHNFPLVNARGKRWNILKHVKTLTEFRPKGWKVHFVAGKQVYQARLCAVRKSAEAAEVARKKMRREAKKQGRALKAETLEAAEYTFVLTTLSREEFSLREVMELYRARWQIELLFKRLKSLLRLGHLPKTRDDSARAWLQAKLLTALLIEELMAQAGFFSPWGHDEASPEVAPAP